MQFYLGSEIYEYTLFVIGQGCCSLCGWFREGIHTLQMCWWIEQQDDYCDTYLLGLFDKIKRMVIIFKYVKPSYYNYVKN